MALRFGDQQAMSLVLPLLFPGEQVLCRARGWEKPWYSTFLFRLGRFLWQNWLVVATNQRLVLVQHDGVLGGYGVQQSETFAWNELDEVALGWGILNKTLRVSSGAKRFGRRIIVPRFWMKGNFAAAHGATGTWLRNR